MDRSIGNTFNVSKEQNTPEIERRRFRPYPEYKDSGVEWLGKIPAHWTLDRLRSTITNCQNGIWGDEPDGINDIPCIRVADFDRLTFCVDKNVPTLRRISPKDTATRIVRSGDLLLEKSGGGDKQPVGAVVQYDYDIVAVCSNFIARMSVAGGFSARFLSYLHAALYAARINVRSIKQNTGIQNLDSSSYLREVVAFPGIGEQRIIARFLNRETAKIDSLIEKKERLIELLREKRTALITQAVTKGLDPTVSMKDSGVEWLGKIPAHWGVMQLKYLVPELTVGIVVTPAKYYVDEGVPCLRSLNISQGKVNMDDLVFISEEANEIHHKSKIFKDDIVVVRTGQAGTAAIVPPLLNGMNCIDLLIIRRSNLLISRLLYYYLNSEAAISQADILSVGAIQAHYNTATLAKLLFPIVPYIEQEEIVEYLDRRTSAIDLLSEKIVAAIAFLKEYRAALISAAVTGKIDIRNMPDDISQ